MKQLFSLVLASILGGAIALGGYALLAPDTVDNTNDTNA